MTILSQTLWSPCLCQWISWSRSTCILAGDYLDPNASLKHTTVSDLFYLNRFFLVFCKEISLGKYLKYAWQVEEHLKSSLHFFLATGNSKKCTFSLMIFPKITIHMNSISKYSNFFTFYTFNPKTASGSQNSFCVQTKINSTLWKNYVFFILLSVAEKVKIGACTGRSFFNRELYFCLRLSSDNNGQKQYTTFFKNSRNFYHFFVWKEYTIYFDEIFFVDAFWNGNEIFTLNDEHKVKQIT